MAPSGESWHIPFIFKYGSQPPNQHLHVVFLQRMTSEERDQVITNLDDTDSEWAGNLDLTASDRRNLVPTPWIRDYWPSSAVILQIARHAWAEGRRQDRYRSLIFVDSGWEAGNVIAARWEGPEEDERFNAVRVPMNVANTLLSTCDANDGFTLFQALREDVYDEAKLDFYKDLKEEPARTEKPYGDFKWPPFIPADLKLDRKKPLIIALKYLSADEIKQLNVGIAGSEKASSLRSGKIDIHNWEGDPCPHKDIDHIFRQVCENSGQDVDKSVIFFVDSILQGSGGEPQLLMAVYYRPGEYNCVKLSPVPTDRLMEAWRAHVGGTNGEDLLDEYTDIWRRETVVDLECSHCDMNRVSAAPVFFLQPFDPEQERRVRAAVSELDDVEDGEDWGNDYIWHGYIWPNDTSKHSMEDLRDLFESCDPFSPSYDSNKPGPYRMVEYPRHFIVVDDRCFEPEPQVIMVSSLDFSPEEGYDQLGWTYGYIDAKTAHIDWVNFDIANIGPEEAIAEPKKLWLSDLKEYAANDWNRDDDE